MPKLAHSSGNTVPLNKYLQYVYILYSKYPMDLVSTYPPTPHRNVADSSVKRVVRDRLEWLKYTFKILKLYNQSKFIIMYSLYTLVFRLIIFFYN